MEERSGLEGEGKRVQCIDGVTEGSAVRQRRGLMSEQSYSTNSKAPLPQPPPGALYSLFDFISALLEVRSLQKVLLPTLPELIYHLLSYMMISEAQVGGVGGGAATHPHMCYFNHLLGGHQMCPLVGHSCACVGEGG